MKINNKIIFIATTIFLLGILTTSSFTKYKNTENINIAKGTINNKVIDKNTVAVLLQDSDGNYQNSNDIPTDGYIFNSNESYCKLGSEKLDIEINYNMETKALTISPLTQKGIKCTLAFDLLNARDKILANMTIITTRSSFTTAITGTSTGTIYTAEDDDGTTYYFAGSPKDNYVSFGGFYWRIIRINGDGSIRMIYQGTSASANGTDTQIGTSSFNQYQDDNMYVGYMYTSGSVHGLGTSSTIKTAVDNWYKSNLINYSTYIDTNAGFCGDRSPYKTSGASGGGTGTTATNYGASKRTTSPSYKCPYSSDLYTISSSNKGNKALTYPVALITSDEYIYSGGFYASEGGYTYLNNGQFQMTMTPYSFSVGAANVFIIYTDGWLTSSYTSSSYAGGIRPVINLRADVTLTGSGTSADPYKVSS